MAARKKTVPCEVGKVVSKLAYVNTDYPKEFCPAESCNVLGKIQLRVTKFNPGTNWIIEVRTDKDKTYIGTLVLSDGEAAQLGKMLLAPE